VKHSTSVLVLLLVSVVLVAFSQIGVVKAEDTIYINSDGSVEGTELLQKNNSTYTFLNDISGTIVVSKDFITIDGAGYSLKGSGGDSSQRGISLSSRKNVTVTNLVILDYSVGIAGTTTNMTVLNNYIHDCEIGIEFSGVTDNLVKYNTFKNNDIDITLNYVTGNNTITHNNLNRYIQVWLSNQPTIDMNYWTNYNGTDTDGDGIGDTPYYYHGILQDSHPLIEPVPTIPEFPSWALLMITLSSAIALAVVYRGKLNEPKRGRK
jgi:parallel beta-helix repeat protein